jgi:hypothetical protein
MVAPVGYHGKLDTPKYIFIVATNGAYTWSCLDRLKKLVRSKVDLSSACAELGATHEIIWLIALFLIDSHVRP